MTLDEAAGHVGGPVLIVEPGRRRVRDGVVRAVDEHLGVKVEVRYGSRGLWRLSGRHEWWPTWKLQVPQWWLLRESAERGSNERTANP